MGAKISRTQIELSDDELNRIVRSYHAWRGQPTAGEYSDKPGFCKTSTTEEIAKAGFALTPGRYVGAVIEEEQAAVTILNFSTPSRNIVCSATVPTRLDGFVQCYLLSSAGGPYGYPLMWLLPASGPVEVGRSDNAPTFAMPTATPSDTARPGGAAFSPARRVARG